MRNFFRLWTTSTRRPRTGTRRPRSRISKRDRTPMVPSRTPASQRTWYWPYPIADSLRYGTWIAASTTVSLRITVTRRLAERVEIADRLSITVDIDGVTKLFPNHGNDSDIRNVTITYSLWVGTNITENCTLKITAPRNTSFYNIMQTAMEMDSHFAFEASEWPNGHYVHTLAGYKEEPMGYHYWLLYRLPEMPNPRSPPANQLVAPVGK